MSINGIDIPEEEFILFLQDEKATTANYFYEKYDADYDGDFWDTTYGDETPIEIAKENALDHLIQTKVEQELAIKYDVLDSSLFQFLEKEISILESAYGADLQNSSQEYMVYHNKVISETSERYKRQSDAIVEEDLVEYYAENKMNLFKAPDDILAIQMSSRLSDGEELSYLNNLVDRIVSDLQNGTSIEDLESDYGEEYQLNIRKRKYGSYEGKDENTSELDALIKDHAYMLDPYVPSKPIQYGDQYFMIVNIDRKVGEVKSYEEVRKTIKNLLKEGQFADMVRKNVEGATVEINDTLYDDLKIQ